MKKQKNTPLVMLDKAWNPSSSTVFKTSLEPNGIIVHNSQDVLSSMQKKEGEKEEDFEIFGIGKMMTKLLLKN